MSVEQGKNREAALNLTTEMPQLAVFLRDGRLLIGAQAASLLYPDRVEEVVELNLTSETEEPPDYPETVEQLVAFIGSDDPYCTLVNSDTGVTVTVSRLMMGEVETLVITPVDRNVVESRATSEAYVFLEQLIRNIGIPASIKVGDRIAMGNSDLAEMLGYTVEELTNRRLRELVLEEDMNDWVALGEVWKELGQAPPVKMRFKRKDGSAVEATLLTVPFFNNGDKIAVTFYVEEKIQDASSNVYMAIAPWFSVVNGYLDRLAIMAGDTGNNAIAKLAQAALSAAAEFQLYVETEGKEPIDTGVIKLGTNIRDVLTTLTTDVNLTVDDNIQDLEVWGNLALFKVILRNLLIGSHDFTVTVNRATDRGVTMDFQNLTPVGGRFAQDACMRMGWELLFYESEGTGTMYSIKIPESQIIVE